MVVSINGVTVLPQNWLVFFGKSIYKWMIWGYPYFRKPPYIATWLVTSQNRKTNHNSFNRILPFYLCGGCYTTIWQCNCKERESPFESQCPNPQSTTRWGTTLW